MVRVRKARRLVVGVLYAALLFAAVPLTSFAAPVDREIAADPAAILRHIEQMNLPDMPDALAAELRGEGIKSALTKFGIKRLIAILPNSIAKKIIRYQDRGATFAELREVTGSNFQALMWYLSPLLLYPGIAH